MTTNPNNLHIYSGIMHDDPAVDPERRMAVFLLDIPRDPPGPDGIMFDVARITAKDDDAYMMTRRLRKGMMIRVWGHLEYSPGKALASTTVADHIAYVGVSVFVKNKRELIEVLGCEKYEERPEIYRDHKAGFVRKDVAVFRLEGKG